MSSTNPTSYTLKESAVKTETKVTPQTPINVSLGADVESKKEDIEKKYTEPCRYWSYIHPDKLTQLQTGREGKGLNHHDEHLFIVVHQTFELWFKQIIYELEWCRTTIMEMVKQGPVPENDSLTLRSYENVYEKYDMGTTLRLLIHRIRRADTILRIATNGFDAMETMEPVDFLEFRDYLIPASGFQSLQMRELEILIGLEDEKRELLNNQVYRQQFVTEKEDFRDVLDRRLAEPSLKEALFTCLAHMTIPLRDEFAKAFETQKIEQYERKKADLRKKLQTWEALAEKLDNITQETISGLQALKDYTAEQLTSRLKEIGLEYNSESRGKKLAHLLVNDPASVPSTIERWVYKDKKTAKLTIQHMIKTCESVDFEIAELQRFFSNTEKINAKKQYCDQYTLGDARKAALYLLSHPWTQPVVGRSKNDYSEWSLLLSTVLKLEQGLLLWRNKHARMVEIMIGRRLGTGGSSGVQYLDKTAEYRIYEDLWRIRALLIPASALKL